MAATDIAHAWPYIYVHLP